MRLPSGGVLGLLLLGLQVQRIKINRLQNEFGEAAFLDHCRNSLARVREEDVRAETADYRRKLFSLVAGDLEQTGLLQLDQEKGFVFFLGFDGNSQHDFVDAALYCGM